MEQDQCSSVVTTVIETDFQINSAPIATQRDAITASRNLEIVIELHGCVQQSFKLLINDTIDANSLSHLLATKLNFLEEERKYYTVILVCTQLDPVKQFKCHYAKTLLDDDLVLDVYDVTIDKMFSKYGEEAIGKFRWFYKDIRSIPLSLCDDGGYMSGDSSDDEEEITPSDLAYIRQADKCAYLLKRSSRDPNVWKRRYCVLTDKFWCVNTNLDMPRAICIPLNSNVLLQDSRPSFNYPNAIVIHNANCVHYYRAPNPAEQQIWIQEFHYRISFQIENETMNHAEFLTCEEEYAACVRCQKACAQIMDSDVFKYALADVSNERVLSTSAWQNVPSNSSAAMKTEYDVYRDIVATENVSNHLVQSPVTSCANTSRSKRPKNICQNIQSEASASAPTVELTSMNWKPISIVVQSKQSLTTDADTIIASGNLSKFSYRKSRRVYSNYSTPSCLQLRVQRRGILSLQDGLRERHPSIFKALQFLQAVQYYKDMHRHDILRDPREIWMSLIAIYSMYLKELLIILTHEQDNKLSSRTYHVNRHSSSSRSRSPGDGRSRGETYKEAFMATQPEDSDCDEPSWYEVGCDEDTIWNVSLETVSEIRDYIESHQYRAQLTTDRSSQIGIISDATPDTSSIQLKISNQLSSTNLFSSWLGLTPSSEVSAPSQPKDTTTNNLNRSRSSLEVSGRQEVLTELSKHYQKYNFFDFYDSVPSPSLFDSLQLELIERVNSCVDDSPGGLFRVVRFYDDITTSIKALPTSIHSSTDVRQQKMLFETMFRHVSGKGFHWGGGIKDLIAIASGRKDENFSAKNRQGRQDDCTTWKNTTSKLKGFTSGNTLAYQHHLSDELAAFEAEKNTWRAVPDDYLHVQDPGNRRYDFTFPTSSAAYPPVHVMGFSTKSSYD